MIQDLHSPTCSGQDPNHPLVTIITVVRNDKDHIQETMQSALAQSGVKVQYIVLDGASTDCTQDKIKEVIERSDSGDIELLYRSAADEGMYDALNQALTLAKGEWISILNSGDTYCSTTALATLINNTHAGGDIIYGHSIAKHPEWDEEIRTSADVDKLQLAPIFRHGSAIIRRHVHQQHPFDLSKKKKLGYSLDWEMLHRLWREGYGFEYVDTHVEKYRTEGLSNYPFRNLLLNYRVISDKRGDKSKWKRQPCSRAKAMAWLAKNTLYTLISNSTLYKYARSFVLYYMVNDIIPHIPFWSWRRFCLSRIGMKIGKGSFVAKNNYLINANRIQIRDHSHINTQCILDARGGIVIGSSVSISHRVNLMTGSHDVQSKEFRGVFKPINIEDNVWIGIGATILQGVTIGKGAVVCAGAVVTHDVEPYTIVAGIPAKKIGNRNEDLNYECKWDEPFT